MARYIFVTGGVVSSLGKGLSSASLAYLLKSQGYKVRLRKMDPYLNVDPGTMSPFQHGEVFVTDDGAETDLDLGHYERFSNISAKKSDNITTGKIYSDVLKRERQGKYLGKTVQVIPHITNRIKEFIKNDVAKEDFVICEIGGTVGDIESLPFLEAIRQLSNEIGKKNTLFIHLTLVPYMKASDEIKTKPTQHSVKELRSIGIQPDIIICRSERSIPLDQRKKISLFCNVAIEDVIETVDVKTIYEAPISFNKEKLDERVIRFFKIKSKKKVNLSPWKKITHLVLNTKNKVNIAIIGKYVELKDAYKSLDEALTHGGIANNLKVNLIRIESDFLKPSEIKNKLKYFLNTEFKNARNFKQKMTWFDGVWSRFKPEIGKDKRGKTGVEKKDLIKIGKKITEVPNGFNIHKTLSKILDNKRKMFTENKPIDWSTAELLAFGTLSMPKRSASSCFSVLALARIGHLLR